MQAREFLKLSNLVKFECVAIKEEYEWVDEVLMRFNYALLRKKSREIKS
ncbi:MAG: hypothetical protein WCK16_04315 [Candidatus Moraniibacteriota bacterium]